MHIRELLELVTGCVSVLNREPMWLKCVPRRKSLLARGEVSVLNREPMWLKFAELLLREGMNRSFSAQP